jgi:hypothetical protein
MNRAQRANLMAGNINALGLILVLLLTAVVLKRYGRRPKSFTRVLSGTAAAFGVMMFVVCCTTVLYHEANSVHQQLIPWICLTLVLVFTGMNRICAAAAIAIGLSSFVWSFHAISLVGPGSPYTGSPYWARRTARVVTRSHLRTVKAVLSMVADGDNQDYLAGWLAESTLKQLIPGDQTPYLTSWSVEIHPFWHTALTGLYHRQLHSLALWYPGGRLKESIQKLEFRPR